MTRWTVSEEEGRCGRCGVAIVAGEPYLHITLPGVIRAAIRCWDHRVGEFDADAYESELNAAWTRIFDRRHSFGPRPVLRYLPPRRRLPRDGKMLALGSDA